MTIQTCSSITRRIGGASLALLAITLLGGTAAPDRDALLEQPKQPLDERIEPSKITEQDPPPLPEQVILPLPATHRIAGSPNQVPISAEHWEKAINAIRDGLKYLRTTQDPSGGWMSGAKAIPTDQPDKPSPIAVAVTALASKAIVQADPHATEAPAFGKAVRFMQRARNADGSYEGGALSNYVTSTVVSALSSIDEFAFREQIRGGVDWLRSSQWDQSEGLKPEQDWFGGAGYGNRGRPDLSNTQMMLDALYDAGLSPEEAPFQRALVFLSRTQNLEQTNNAEWAGNDGGFVYTPANGGESIASEVAGDGRHGEKIPPGQPRSLRSYGSMTYAGFKSMLYAGLSPDDVRVRAAYDWIRKHFTFDENPGLGQQGLYYYYHAMSRALRVAQQHEIVDVDGETHNWREALVDAIVERQRDDGSWVNDADRWLEGNPELVTAYSLLALEEALKPVSMMGNERSAEPTDDGPKDASDSKRPDER